MIYDVEEDKLIKLIDISLADIKGSESMMEDEATKDKVDDVISISF